MVGPDEEHRRLLFTAMHLQQALVNSSVPKLTVVLRKAYGLAHHLLAGCGMGADLLCAWPGSEFGFMDPEVGANVLHGRELAGLEGEERRARRRLRAEELRRETDVWGPAGAMSIDDVIEPDETRDILRAHLDRLMEGRSAADHDHALAGWPTSW
jgi:acetyl-CoA carboxylase carboxyltransferase component